MLWILVTNAASVSARECSLKSHLVGIAHPWNNIVLPDRTQIDATQIFVSWFHDSLKGFKIIICVSRIETRTLWQLFLVIFLSASIKRTYLSKVRVRNIGNTKSNVCTWKRVGLWVNLEWKKSRFALKLVGCNTTNRTGVDVRGFEAFLWRSDSLVGKWRHKFQRIEEKTTTNRERKSNLFSDCGWLC